MAAPIKQKEELFRFAQNGDLQKIEEFIAHNYSSDNSWMDLYHNKTGDTVLSFAVRGGNCKILQFLKRHGQNFEQGNFDGKRALHEAAQFGHISCLNFLLNENVLIDPLKRADW